MPGTSLRAQFGLPVAILDSARWRTQRTQQLGPRVLLALFISLALVFAKTLAASGFVAYLATLREPGTLTAVRLTLTAADCSPAP